MRRVLVPIDGTERSASILPDARRLAGSDGTIILVRDAGAVAYSSTTLVGLSEMQEHYRPADPLPALPSHRGPVHGGGG
jgi:nucleotide-binding universal stress UspA family protein